MESPTKITRTQLFEMVREEVELQEKKKLLESRMYNIKAELNVLNEGKNPFDNDEDKDDINPTGASDWNKKKKDVDEGMLQNIGRGISNAFSGAKQATKGAVQNYQQGSDSNKLKNITADIQSKQQELNALKQQYKTLTSQDFSNKGAQGATALPRNQQNVFKTKQAPAKTASTPPVVTPVMPAPAPIKKAQIKQVPAKVAQKKMQAPIKKTGTKAGVIPKPAVKKKVAENKK